MAKGLLSLITLFLAINLFNYYQLALVLNEVSSREYTEGYKCLDFSKDLQRELNNIGIQSEIVIGESPETAKQPKVEHAWIGLWIEPQTGQFTKDYKKPSRTSN